MAIMLFAFKEKRQHTVQEKCFQPFQHFNTTLTGKTTLDQKMVLLSPYVACASTESHSKPLTAYAEEEELDASAEHDVKVAEPSNVKSPPEI